MKNICELYKLVILLLKAEVSLDLKVCGVRRVSFIVFIVLEHRYDVTRTSMAELTDANQIRAFLIITIVFKSLSYSNYF